MSVASAIAAVKRGRVAAGALMVDTCTITRLAGESTDGAGHITKTYTTVYTGKCKVQRSMHPTNARSENVAEAQEWLSRLELHLPTSATGAASEDVVTVTASQDPELVGQTFFLRQLAHKTFQTARRFGLEEVTS